MDAVEILHVADADLEEVVEIAGHQVAIQHEFQLRDRPLEGGKAFRCGAVEHDADHDEGPLADLPRRHHRPDPCYEPLVEQALGAPVTGRGADTGRFGQLGIGQPAAILQQTQYLKVDAVESAGHERISRKYHQ